MQSATSILEQLDEEGYVVVDDVLDPVADFAPLLEELTALTERRHKEFPPNLDTRLDRLTPREREIAQLIGGGASNKEIAGRLNITEATVKAHLTAIFRKLGLSDRLGLALFVTEYNRVAR